MTKLRRVGFFNEMPHGDPTDPSLAVSREATADADELLLANYLEAGAVYIATPGLAVDVLDGQTPIGPPNYLTDGLFVWPSDAPYYVRTYHVRFPTEFIEHARANGWLVPPRIDLLPLQL
jgi:hypothetical protein